MDFSLVNVFGAASAPGMSPAAQAGDSPSALTGDLSSGVDFAELIDEAALNLDDACEEALDAFPNDVAFPSAWPFDGGKTNWLLSLAASAGQGTGLNDTGGEEQVPEEAPADVVGDSSPDTGLLNTAWLFAQPVSRLAHRAASGAAPDSNEASRGEPAAVAAGTLPNGSSQNAWPVPLGSVEAAEPELDSAGRATMANEVTEPAHTESGDGLPTPTKTSQYGLNVMRAAEIHQPGNPEEGQQGNQSASVSEQQSIRQAAVPRENIDGPSAQPVETAAAASRPSGPGERATGDREDTFDLNNAETPDAAMPHERGAFSFSGNSPRDMAEAPARTRPVSAATGSAPVFDVPSGTAAGSGTVGIAEAAATTERPSSPGPENLKQLVQAIRMQFRNGVGDAVLRLNPEHLGAVSISLRVEQGSVSATVTAEAPAVRQWLEQQEAALRQGLAGQGLQLERFVVQRDGHSPDQGKQDKPDRRRQQHRGRDGEVATFEITV